MERFREQIPVISGQKIFANRDCDSAKARKMEDMDHRFWRDQIFLPCFISFFKREGILLLLDTQTTAALIKHMDFIFPLVPNGRTDNQK